MSKLKSIIAVLPFAMKNLGRWRFRLLTIGLLVIMTANLSVLYQSMLLSQQNTGSLQAVQLELPYDLLVRLPEGAMPKPLEALPAPLDPYDYGKGKSNIYTVLSKPMPFSHAENLLIYPCFSPYGTWEVWGIEQGSEFFTWDTLTEKAVNQIIPGEILLPKDYASRFGYRVGDSLSLAFFLNNNELNQVDFVVGGFLNTDNDLQKPLVLKEDLLKLTGNSPINAQLLACSEIRSHTTGLVRNMNKVYPGAEFIYPTMPTDRATEAIADIQSPAAWVIRLIYAFLGLGIMTIALMTFLERRKELAILKSIGLRFTQIVSLYLAEYGFVYFGGLIIGYIVLAFLLPYFHWSSQLTQNQLTSLMLNNALTTLGIFLLAVMYPILLSRAASVNQLVFARQIPLFTARIDHLLRPKPELLFREREENVRILQADSIDQRLSGAFLRHPGEHVKQGEVVVIQESWFGFRYREWIAPCDGTFTEYNIYTGVMVFKPDQPNAPKYPYPADILTTYDRRQAAFQSGQSNGSY